MTVPFLFISAMPCPPAHTLTYPIESLVRQKLSATANDSSSRAGSKEEDTATDTQIRLLVRLRIIEQLQSLAHPRVHCLYEHAILDVLNWIAQCFAVDPSGDGIAVALSTRPGLVTLHICHDEEQPTIKSVVRSTKSFLSTLRTVLRADEDGATGSSATASLGPFFRMIVDLTYKRIQRKLSRIGETEESAEETAYRFASLVTMWMEYRPEGEQSRGFLRMASQYGGDANRANEYLIQSFFTIVKQTEDHADDMTPDQRFTYLASIITNCNLLINSSFFDDLINHRLFRADLKLQDRMFLHKILRRLTYLASYKTGAAKFVFLGVPFIRQILGPSGVAKFIDGGGGISVELVTQNMLASDSPVPLVAKSCFWPSESPAEYLPPMLNIDVNDLHTPPQAHSRDTSEASAVSASTASSDSSRYDRAELLRLDNQLRYELLSSAMIADAWSEGDAIRAKCHPEMQLIHYLEERNVEVAYQAIGTSKSVCWACSMYIEHLNGEGKGRDGEDEDAGPGNIGEAEEECYSRKWLLKKDGAGKVKSDWMIPPKAKPKLVGALVEDAQKEMERAIEDVAFECYL